MFKFLHTADWQIGRQYGQFESEDAALLSQARLDVVGAIAALANKHEVHAVLVAGDVFDMQGVSDRTIRQLFAQLDAFRGDWVMIAGNHDAALAESVWTRARELGCVPANVHIPQGTGIVSLPGADVLAAPLTQRHTYGDVTEAFDSLESDAGRLRIGLAHGSVAGRLDAAIDSANPIAADRASRARLDYLALGDWHGCLRIDAFTWYAGTPETDRFRNNDPGHVLLVEIEPDSSEPRVQPVAVGRYRWLSWSETLLVASDIDALDQRLLPLNAHDVLRLEVSGALSLAAWDRLKEVVGRAEARVRALRLDTTGVRLEPDAHDLTELGADGYVGTVAAQLQALQEDEGRAEVAREALRLLVQLQRETAARGQDGERTS